MSLKNCKSIKTFKFRDNVFTNLKSLQAILYYLKKTSQYAKFSIKNRFSINIMTLSNKPPLMIEKITKTLLFVAVDNLQTLKSYLQSYAIREIYKIPNNESCVCAIFYNIKESEHCHTTLKYYKSYYTIHKYELPKDQEKCDNSKNQSTLFIYCKNNASFDDKEVFCYDDIREVRSANPLKKCVEFFDSRVADKFYQDFNGKPYEDTELIVKYAWDMSTKTKWDIIRATDHVISENVCRKSKIKKNMFIELFDNFICENIDKITEFYK